MGDDLARLLDGFEDRADYRLVLADALQERGREDEAEVCRDLSCLAWVRGGRIEPVGGALGFALILGELVGEHGPGRCRRWLGRQIARLCREVAKKA